MNETNSLINSVDIAVFAVMLACMLLGGLKGLIVQVLGIFSLAVGVLSSALAGPFVADAAGRWIENPTAARFFGHIAVFLVAAGVVRLIGAVGKKAAEATGLSMVDRLGGALLGILKGWLLCSILLVIAAQHGSERIREALDTSFSGFVMIRASDAAVEWCRTRDVTEKIADMSRDLAEKTREIREQISERAADGAADGGVVEEAGSSGALPHGDE